VLALAFTFSCSSDSGGSSGGDDGNGDGSYTQSWPSSSVLEKYGLSGMTAPAGATNVEYQAIDQAAGVTLSINFKSSANETSSLHTFFTGKGWVKEDEGWGEIGDADVYWTYRKGNDYLSYGRGNSTGSSIYVIKNYPFDD
jgi:hypothetical protein